MAPDFGENWSSAIRDSQKRFRKKTACLAWYDRNYTVSFTYHVAVVPTSEAAHKGVNDAVRCRREVVTFAPGSFEGAMGFSTNSVRSRSSQT